MIGVAVALVIGAVLFRVRGGLLGDYGILGNGTTGISRIIYAASLAAFIVLLTWNLWLAALAPALFVGCVLPWWGSIDMARDKGKWFRDFILQSARGLLFTLPAGVVLWWLGYEWWPGLVGLSAGLLYELGWCIPSKVKGLETGSPIGEALLGAVIGGSLAAVTYI